MPELVQIVLALSPPAVAAYALYLNGRRQDRGFQHEREMTDLRDTRQLLGDSAAALHRADYAQMELVSGYGQHVEKLRDRKPDVIPELVKAGRELDALLERLAVYLGGDHPAFAAFFEADEALLEMSRAVGYLELDEGDPDVGERRRERRERLEAAGKRFDQAFAEFRKRAYEAGGVQLPKSAPGKRRLLSP